MIRAGAALHGLRPVHLLLFLPWLAPLVWMADAGWFLNDDAYISFRYARNLLEGHGLVFNPGERVEGYTNLLWVLELAALWGAFGLLPEHAAPWLSVAFTAATLVAMLWWVARLPSLAHRGLVGWMALGLVCSSATFAVWTPGAGLETRQFTFFVVLAVVCLSLYRDGRRALLVVSWSLAAASLTRPEGPLFAACCFGWFAVQRRADTGRWFPDRRAAAYLVVPCVVVVAGHYLFRYGYYGEWLPNTYYAKHVRPWYEMGLLYLATAALETGLYLLLPLAALSLVKGGERGRMYALPLVCIALHMAYVARIGGDVFGYRPLDFYWPVLAVPAAEGIVHLGRRAARAARRLRPSASRRPAAMTRLCATALFLPVLFYSSAMQAAWLSEAVEMPLLPGPPPPPLNLDAGNAGWLLAAPGMPALVAASSALRSLSFPKRVGRRLVGRRPDKIDEWKGYRGMERGIIPQDALMSTRAAGRLPYYVPDLKFIDVHGLTDKTIARNPVATPNSWRIMAHDRSPPPGYLAERGVNFLAYPPAASADEALEHAVYAVQAGPGVWMPFDAPDLEWVEERFEAFSYDTEADRRLDEALDHARLLTDARFDVWLDGSRLLYVKDRCDVHEMRFYLHVVPADRGDLPAGRRRFGFENLDFDLSEARLGTARRCVAWRPLPDYPVAVIRTGQFRRAGMGDPYRLWGGELPFEEDARTTGAPSGSGSSRPPAQGKTGREGSVETGRAPGRL